MIRFDQLSDDPASQLVAWRWLRWTFFVGAVVDLSFGLGILLIPERLSPLLQISIPAESSRVFFDLNGLFLVFLGWLYLMVFAWPRRLVPVAAWAALLRIGGFALFAAASYTGRAEPSFWAFAQIDAVLAFAHLIVVRLAAGGVLRALLGRVG